MNPIDQAFLNAYSKKKAATRPQEKSAPTEQVRPLGEQTAGKQNFAHLPTQPSKPPQPHFQPAAVSTPSHRSPSIIVPTEDSSAGSLEKLKENALLSQPTIRLRVDHSAEPKNHFAVPQVNMQPLKTRFTEEDSATEGKRRTLTSYLQKSREAVDPSSEAVPMPSSTASQPEISTRWSTLGNPPVQGHRIDPAHEKYPPVNRPESNLPWSTFGAERATKSTASSQATVARTLNPPAVKSTNPPLARPMNPPQMERLNPAFESRLQSIQATPTKESEATSTPRPSFPQREAEPAVAVKIPSPIEAIWEVDQFYWPAAVANLLETQKDAFTDIGLHLQHIQSKGLRVLSVTSGERGVGRSTVALCLAKTVAMAGLRVAILDGDYECPSIVDHLNLAVDYGWQQCLSDNIPLDEVVIQSIDDNVAVVPLTDSIPTSTVQDQASRINKLIKRLSQAYDFVIIDGNRLTQKNPRLLGTGPESILDAAIVVVDAELSLRQRVDNAIELIRHQGIQSIGIAENFHSEAKA